MGEKLGKEDSRLYKIKSAHISSHNKKYRKIKIIETSNILEDIVKILNINIIQNFTYLDFYLTKCI